MIQTQREMAIILEAEAGLTSEGQGDFRIETEPPKGYIRNVDKRNRERKPFCLSEPEPFN